MNNDNEPEIDVPEENLAAGMPVAVIKAPVPEIQTPSQSKDRAIAELTMSAYQKAATLKLTAEETAALQRDFPDEAFKQGAGGDPNLIYIEHAFLRDRFTEVFGMGQWSIIPRNRWAEPFKTQKGLDGSRVYVEAMLVVRGCFVAEAIGSMEYYPHNPTQNYGDAVEGAKTAALRRCAKELGVGLQAWKRDWCLGWFSRKLKNTVKPTPRAPKPSAPSEPTKEEQQAKAKKFADRLADRKEMATQYCVDLGWILPSNEGLEDVPFNHLPKTEKMFDNFVRSMDIWMKHGVVQDPYEPVKSVEQNVPHGTSGEPSEDTDDAEEQPWYKSEVPVPHKGQKREEYMKNPETIGQLYELRHDDEEARNRLFGFVNHYEPKGWTKRDGTKMPPSKKDIQFRSDLDAFWDWFKETHPDEAD